MGSEMCIRDSNHGTLPGPSNILGRLKLVNPNVNGLERKADGLYGMKDNSTADADASVKIASGALEGSNVNVVDAMVNMISLARQFETQMKLIQSAENNADKASQLFNLNV